MPEPRMPYDYARCINGVCPLREKCLRFLAPGRPDGPQVYSAFPGGKNCDGFIPMEGEDDE